MSEAKMTESNVVGWVFEGADGARWAVQAETKEAALKIFTSTAPSSAEIVASDRSNATTLASINSRRAGRSRSGSAATVAAKRHGTEFN
jgi:hypothetical protein